MRRHRTRLSLVAGLVALASVFVGFGQDELLGRWILVKQTYETGERDLARGDVPPRLTFERGAEGRRATLTWEGRSAAWPAYPSPDGFASITGATVEYGADGGSVVARYVVERAPDDDTALRVEERYALAPSGALTGTMQIEFLRDGEARGGFTWHRVFEREE